MARRSGHRCSDKERLWRRLLRQWQRSGLSVRNFCAERELSEASFYAWRRSIAQRDQQHAQQDRPGTPMRYPTDDVEREPTFAPVRVMPGAGMVLEVVLGVRVVRVPAGFDAATLRQLLAVLEEEGPSC